MQFDRKAPLIAVVAVAVGAAAGYVTGVLTAPASGAAVRKELAWRARWKQRQLLRRGRHAIDRAAGRVQHQFARGRRALSRTLAS